MSTTHVTAAQPARALDLASVKSRHTELYEQIQLVKEELKKDPAKRREIQPELDRFIATLRDLSIRITRTGDYSEYDWLDAAATKWQEVFSWIMTEPRNIRTEINLPAPPPTTVRSRERAELPRSAIESDIAECAFFLGAERKLRALTARIQELRELERGKSRIHGLIPSTPEEEKQDWNHALIYFASDVLAGRTDFVYQLGPECYADLEQVPLNQVKRLNAYHAAVSGVYADSRECYLKACEDLRCMLLNRNIKASPADFVIVRKYLTSSQTPAKQETMIAQKAHVRWEIRTSYGEPGTETEDWTEAAEYVKRFYTNAIRAVEARCASSMEKALSVFRKAWRKYDLVNCFEAAIAIYFFDPDLIRKCCENQQDIL